ncbi:OsmC family protein [Paractinoplanes bogorensis]|uniref:OsmC family protein n=1 Tax=Paractinoplanes bogorensis TaxID=1610840 RepID=UPI0027E1CEA7|nr:OsmC family protein [Actinoplanes bogorensis]
MEADFTGAHLLHLAAAGCVLNDLYREAQQLGLVLNGVRVTASGGFDSATWVSTGITYGIELDSTASEEERTALVARVDEVAEIPRAIRAGAPVQRRD